MMIYHNLVNTPPEKNIHAKLPHKGKMHPLDDTWHHR